MDNTLNTLNTLNVIQKSLENSITVKNNILKSTTLLLSVQQTAKVMIESLQLGNSILFCGNGGSAADAQHLSAELSGRFNFDRPPLSSHALHCNSSYLTAVANDYGYEYIYQRLVLAIGKKNDVLIGLSTSGNSTNIIKAFETAKTMNITTVALTGETGGELLSFADILINVPSKETPRIQEAHITIGHILCEIVEKTLFSK